MALSLRASFPIVTAAASPLSVAKPTGTAQDDLLLLQVNTVDDVVPTPPPGFVFAAGVTGVANSVRIYWKRATAAEPATYTVSWPGGNNGNLALVAVDASGVNYPVIHAVATNSSDSASTNRVWSGVTNSVANTLLLCFGNILTGSGNTADAAMTERYDGGSSTILLYMMSQAVAATGATGTRTATGASSSRVRTVTISLEDSATPPPDLPKELDVTGVGVYAEMLADPAVEVTEVAVYAALGAVGIYVTEVGTYAAIGAVGVYVTEVGVYAALEYEPEEEVMPVAFPANAGTRRMHTALPDEVSGYAFDPAYSWWSAIVAEESTNLLLNPSFEAWNDIDNVVEYDSSGDVTLDWVQFPLVGATAGRRCAKLTGGASTGWLYTDQTLHITPGPYTFSLDVYVTRVPYTLVLLAVTDAGATQLGRRAFNVTSTGWQRLSMTFVNAGSVDVELRMILLNTNPAGVVVYTDAWQFEAKGYATTYLDGDMIGYSDTAPNQSYFWHGEPHRSPSTRRKRTGSGGRVVSWSMEARFKTTAIVGLGMTTVEQKTQTLGDGREVHLAMQDKSRDFTITGRIFADNPYELRRRSNDLISLLKGNNTPGGDQMKLRFQETDDRGLLIGATLDITCVYRDGLQGNMTNFYQTNLPLQFHAVDPYPSDIIESSVQLELAKAVSSDGLFYRDENGEYHDLTHGGHILDGVVQNVGFMRDGTMVAIGNFTDIGGDTVGGAATWDGSHWQQLGTPAPVSATDIDDGFQLGYPLTLSAVDGNIYEWDDISNVWNTLGSHGFNNTIYALQRDMYGDIWVGGEFDFAEDGTTKWHRVARYNSQTGDWEQLGGGVSDPYDFFPDPIAVHAVLATNDGSVYFGGSFGEGDTNYDPLPPTVLAKGVARWDIATSTWNRVGTGLGGTVQHLLRGPDGYVYAVGDFTTDAGLNPFPLRGFARFNGANWEEVFELVNQDGDHGADGVTIDSEGIFWFWNFVGDPDHDTFVVPGVGNVGSFGWRDGIFYPPEVPDAGMHAIAYGPAGIAIFSAHSYLGGSVMYVPVVNEINYGGSADAPLVIRLHGGGQFIHCLNRSTEGGVYGRDNFIISANEEVFIRSDSQRMMVYSNQRLNITGQVSVGASNMKALRLVPGLNRISMLITHVDGNEYGWLGWKNRYASLMEGVQ